MQHFKKIAISVAVIFLFNILLEWAFSVPAVFHFYASGIFTPFQQFRSRLWNPVPFSVGDCLIIIGIAVAVTAFIRLCRKKLPGWGWPKRLCWKLLKIINAAGIILLVFTLCWGGNYHRQPLSRQFPVAVWDTASLIDLNQILLQRLNQRCRQVNFPDIGTANGKLYRYYRHYLGDNVPAVKVKISLLSPFINRMNTVGFYNPFTGEAQITDDYPVYFYPAIMAHEMAHQLGIAAEDDANFMAYIICAQSGDPAFMYSAHLDLFLYANGELRMYDSVRAKQYYAGLDTVVKQQIKTLRDRNFRYRGPLGQWSMFLYDKYLRSNGIASGINAYNAVTRKVYTWEKLGKPAVHL